MIIVELVGGLGNQLFQYAFGLNLSIKHNFPLKIEKTKFSRHVFRLDKFNIDLTEASPEEIKYLKRKEIKGIAGKIKRKLTGKGFYINNKYHIAENTFDHDKSKLEKPLHLYISGFWFDQKYFIESEDIIRKKFSLCAPLNKESQLIYQDIISRESVFIHIRRGEYLSNSFFAELSLAYYTKAADYCSRHILNPVFYIFSDDIHWCKENFKIDHEYHYVDANNDISDYMDLALMYSCQHGIIANSTFSWWGAWLIGNKDKIIIAPKVWWNDAPSQAEYEAGRFVPSNWIKI
jgi:hypothetical protein